MQDNIAGCKSIFARVISDAFDEAVASCKPCPTDKFTLERRKTRKRKLRNAFIVVCKSYPYAGDNQYKISFLLIDLLAKIYRVMDIYSNFIDEKSYYARQFLTDQNPNFCWYCDQIDVDPVYASEKLQKEIACSDFYGKIFYINCVNLLTFEKSIPMMKYILKMIA
jgi:hypothetical protein